MAEEAEHQQDVEPKACIFISYSRKDMAFADRLETALKARGFEPLIDRTEIYAFEDWWKRIEALIGKADTVVFVLSPDAVASEVALKEVTHAASLNKRFAPIVCRRVEDRAIPEALQRLNFIFFDDPARFDASADRLAEALQTDIGWVRQHTEFGEAARRGRRPPARAGCCCVRPFWRRPSGGSPRARAARRSRPRRPKHSSPRADAAPRGGATSSRAALPLGSLSRSRSRVSPIGSAELPSSSGNWPNCNATARRSDAYRRNKNRQQSGLRPGAAVPRHGGNSSRANQGHSRPGAGAAGAAYPLRGSDAGT